MSNHPNRNKVRDWPEFLRDFRKLNKYSQKQLADLLQVSKRNVENWEEGLSVPPAYLKKALDTIKKD